MPSTEFLLFLSITFIVSASPGPVMLMCMNNGGRYGIAKAYEGMVGASVGNLCLMGLSALGLGLLISQNDFLFNMMKWLGAFYLVYLGVQAMRQTTPISRLEHTRLDNPHSLLFSSFFIALSNPKGFIYFGALFPQFIDYHQPLALQYGVLTISFLLMDLVWMFAYAVAGNAIMQWLKAPKHHRLFHQISGSLLIAAGLFMALTGKIH